MHKSNLTDGSTIEIDIEIENFPMGIIETEIELNLIIETSQIQVSTAVGDHAKSKTKTNKPSLGLPAVTVVYLLTTEHTDTDNIHIAKQFCIFSCTTRVQLGKQTPPTLP